MVVVCAAEWAAESGMDTRVSATGSYIPAGFDEALRGSETSKRCPEGARGRIEPCATGHHRAVLCSRGRSSLLFNDFVFVFPVLKLKLSYAPTYG